MKILLIFLILNIVSCDVALAYTDSQIADAIYKAEGGARYKYGISYKCFKVKSMSLTQARRICLNTIRHAKRDWDRQGDFISFLGNRYCPSTHDRQGNINWIKNVKYFLARAK